MVHLPFADRLEAGRLLAAELSFRKLTENAVVRALTRGGVPVGFAVADRLRLPLEAISARKLGVPWQPELAMGAITSTTRILDERMIKHLGISVQEVEDIISREQAEITRQEELYRDGRAEVEFYGRPAILVDDGLATGSTMLAAIRYVRSLAPSRVVIGVPVGSKQACERLARQVDDFVCLATPDLFFAVGEWYTDFQQISDSEVKRILTEGRRMLQKHAAAATAT
jgi:putative phosphoribosyl transferase